MERTACKELNINRLSAKLTFSQDSISLEIHVASGSDNEK